MPLWWWLIYACRFCNLPHSPILTPPHLRHSSFSNPSAALPTPQLILQPFNCFTYVIGTSPTLPGEPPMPLWCLIYPCRFCNLPHSPILTSLHLRHSSFSNSSAALPTSQLILQPFFCFSYVTGSSLTSPGEPPMELIQTNKQTKHRLQKEDYESLKVFLV